MFPLSLRTLPVAVVAALFFGAPVVAQEVGPLTTFTNGTKTNADEVNANFSAVKGAVDNNHGRVVNLESAVSTHSTDIGDIKSKDAAQDTSIGTLTSSSTDHENRLKAVEGTNDTQTVNINLLGNTVGDHTTNLGTLNSTVGTHTTEIGGVKAKNVEQDGTISALGSMVSDHRDELLLLRTTNEDQTSRLNGHDALLNELTSASGNLIPNWNFVHGAEGWTELSASGQFTIADTPGGPAGEKSLSNATSSAPRITSTQLIPIDRNQTYRVTGTYRLRLSGGSGAVFIGVRLFNSSKTSIEKDFTDFWYLPVNNVTPLNTGEWIHFVAYFGAGTNQPFPNTARYATVATNLNFGGTGFNVYEVQGLGIYLAEQGPSWTDLPLGTGIVAYGGSYQAPQYRLVGDEVCLRGAVKTSSGAFIPPRPSTVGTLPVGYRPTQSLSFPVAFIFVTSIMEVAANGELTFFSSAGTPSTSLSGICFSLTP